MTHGTNLALRTTSLPAPDEWRGIVAIATKLANTRIVPKPYWNKPDDIVAAALLGRNIGLDPMQSLLYVHVIEGKPSLSAECMVALVRREGHTIRAIRLDDEAAHVEGVRKDDGQRADFMFTKAHAEAAGLASKDNWRAYFRSMAWARATSQLCRMLFPDVISGMSYTPEELGAEVDGDGTPVDSMVKATDVPPALGGPAAATAQEEAAEEVTDVEVVEETTPADMPVEGADEATVVEEEPETPPAAEQEPEAPAPTQAPATPQEVAQAVPGVSVGVPADPTTPAPIAPEDVDPYATPDTGQAAAELSPDDPYYTPPPPPKTPEQIHQDVGTELFPKGWPAKGRSGDMKGRSPWEVGDDDLRWLAEQETRNPKYAEDDEAKRQWCRAELRRRNLAANPEPQAAGKARNPETTSDLDAAFQQAVAADGDDDLPLDMLNDDDLLTRQARRDMAKAMADTGYATSLEHGLERIAGLEERAGERMTAARARANVAHFRANPSVAS